jgi:hypothetical protein
MGTPRSPRRATDRERIRRLNARLDAVMAESKRIRREMEDRRERPSHSGSIRDGQHGGQRPLAPAAASRTSNEPRTTGDLARRLCSPTAPDPAVRAPASLDPPLLGVPAVAEHLCPADEAHAGPPRHARAF